MNLVLLYTALSVFGLGVTVIDFLGILDQPGEGPGNGDAGETDGGDSDDGDGGGPDDGDDGGDSDRGDSDGGQGRASYLSPGSSGVKAVTAVMGLLRTAVYFSLGFGPTGLFALFRGLSRNQGLFWAVGVGAAVAVLARALRGFIRRDLDSSIKPEEFLMEKAVLLLPMTPGSISRAAVKQYGKETELYVKCRDPRAAMEKGTEVLISDYDNEVYWVESLKQ
ncbi:MAG: hypothetical protein LBI67_03930 [Treponema sp.]|jgi:hypothetical protein|nr:hypothetical protein [Treponema sp.]